MADREPLNISVNPSMPLIKGQASLEASSLACWRAGRGMGRERVIGIY